MVQCEVLLFDKGVKKVFQKVSVVTYALPNHDVHDGQHKMARFMIHPSSVECDAIEYLGSSKVSKVAILIIVTER